MTGKGTKKWSEIRRAHSLEDREAIDAIKAGMAEAERLFELRKGRGITQVELADRLGVSQGNVSEIERREDLFLSTLNGYVAALGGRLRVVADFDDGPVTITAYEGPGASLGAAIPAVPEATAGQAPGAAIPR